MPSPALAGILQALGAGFGGYAQDQKARQERDRAKLLDTQSAQRLGLDTERLGMDRVTHQASMDDVKAKLAERQAATARGTAGEQTINDNWSAAVGGDRMAQAKIVAYRPDLANEFNKPAPAHNIDPSSQEGIDAAARRAGAVAKAEAPFKTPAPASRDSFTPVTLGTEVKPFNNRTGTVGETIGAAKPASGRLAGASLQKALAANSTQLSIIDDALNELGAHPSAVGLSRGLPMIGDRLDQRVDQQGVAARAQIANIGSLQIHDRSGAAVSVHEMPRLAPFVPSVSDTPETIRTKLTKLRAAIATETSALQGGQPPTGGPSDTAPNAPSGDVNLSAPDPQFAERAAQLRRQGLSRAAAMQQLKDEGYDLATGAKARRP